MKICDWEIKKFGIAPSTYAHMTAPVKLSSCSSRTAVIAQILTRPLWSLFVETIQVVVQTRTRQRFCWEIRYISISLDRPQFRGSFGKLVPDIVPARPNVSHSSAVGRIGRQNIICLIINPHLKYNTPLRKKSISTSRSPRPFIISSQAATYSALAVVDATIL